MKKNIAALLMIVCFYSTHSVANEGKIYVNSKDVLVAENGIIANINGNATLIRALRYEDGKLYIQPEENWICIKGHIVLPWEGTICPKCGANCNEHG